MTVGKQFEKNFAMICFLLSPSGGKRKTHFSLQNSERLFCLPTVTPSPPVSAIMALNIMYRQKRQTATAPGYRLFLLPFLCMMKLTIFQRKSQNIIDIYIDWQDPSGQFTYTASQNPIAMIQQRNVEADSFLTHSLRNFQIT